MRYWVRLDRDVVTVDGPEAEPFLQGQLSQDVAALAPGSSAWSWLLAPTGKVDALVRVSRRAGGGWVLDTDAGWGDPVLARLQKFKLRTKADIERVPATAGRRPRPRPAPTPGPADRRPSPGPAPGRLWSAA